MITQQAEILIEESLFESFIFGRAYHPEKPGFMVIKEEIHTPELTNNAPILIQPQRVYQVLEISKGIQIRILKFNR